MSELHKRYWLEGFRASTDFLGRWVEHSQNVQSSIALAVSDVQPSRVVLVGAGARPTSTDLHPDLLASGQITSLVLIDAYEDVLECAVADIARVNSNLLVESLVHDITDGEASRLASCLTPTVMLDESRRSHAFPQSEILPPAEVPIRSSCELIVFSMCIAATLAVEFGAACSTLGCSSATAMVAQPLYHWYAKYNAQLFHHVARKLRVSAPTRDAAVLIISDTDWMFPDGVVPQFTPNFEDVLCNEIHPGAILRRSSWIWDECDEHSHRVSAALVRL